MPKSSGSIPDRRLAFGQTMACSSAVERLTVNQVVASSILAGPARAINSAVECAPYKCEVTGSNPVSPIPLLKQNQVKPTYYLQPHD